MRGLKNASDHLQQRAFARSVLTDDAKCFAGWNFERDVAQGPKIAMERDAIQQSEFLESRTWRRVDRIALRYAAEFDDRRGHSVSNLLEGRGSVKSDELAQGDRQLLHCRRDELKHRHGTHPLVRGGHSLVCI